jgi:outer membrane lipase/esterase
VSGLIFVFNDQFNQRLAGLADGIIPINAYGLINEVIADPASYGFTNVSGTACNIACCRTTARCSAARPPT